MGLVGLEPGTFWLIVKRFNHLATQNTKHTCNHKHTHIPSCLHATLASSMFHPSSHTVPHVLFKNISTRPYVNVCPVEFEVCVPLLRRIERLGAVKEAEGGMVGGREGEREEGRKGGSEGWWEEEREGWSEGG